MFAVGNVVLDSLVLARRCWMLFVWCCSVVVDPLGISRGAVDDEGSRIVHAFGYFDSKTGDDVLRRKLRYFYRHCECQTVGRLAELVGASCEFVVVRHGMVASVSLNMTALKADVVVVSDQTASDGKQVDVRTIDLDMELVDLETLIDN